VNKTNFLFKVSFGPFIALIVMLANPLLIADESATGINFEHGAINILLHDKSAGGRRTIDLEHERISTGTTLLKDQNTGLPLTVAEHYKVIALDPNYVKLRIQLKTIDPDAADVISYIHVIKITDSKTQVLTPFKGVSLEITFKSGPVSAK
jgi:hypothetical protein